ncbi:NB-ARC domain containing protein [Parasponia andersonii]|uniref:NB-ARC domain containing protein n=1 Tax=Parasponia andersonii TaxID=3476 RepID=A0A2P5AQ68_PARAD|nr:NB-ARC domain containing protein [Parasponia andersonii]
MAETAVSLVRDKLIPLLTEEANLLRGVQKEVEEIRCDLDYNLAFLKGAYARALADQGTNGSHGVKVWVEKLRRAAFEVEDVIDEYMHLMAQQQHPHKHRFIGFLHRSACLIIKLKSRHDIASKIQDIRQTIRSINQRSSSFGFISSLHQGSTYISQSNTWHDPRKDSSFLKEIDVVGIHSTRDELIGRIEVGSSRRNVISIVGMGGLGKTTLAHQVYVHTKGSFDCHAWIDVSHSYIRVELLQKLMKKFYDSVPERVYAMDETIVTTRLKDYLPGKGYLVIFYDVWSINFWCDIKDGLPDDNEKIGRIEITTRYVQVANFCKISLFVHIHHLQPLPPEKAWKLFCSKDFQYELEECWESD